MKTKIIELDISVRHIALVEIFFKANELYDLGLKLEIVDTVFETPLTITPPTGVDNQRTITFNQTKKTLVCIYDEENEEQTSKIMFMSIKHLGFNNMLHDFLNKCGIPVNFHTQ
jgi:hypothetical protein